MTIPRRQFLRLALGAAAAPAPALPIIARAQTYPTPLGAHRRAVSRGQRERHPRAPCRSTSSFDFPLPAAVSDLPLAKPARSTIRPPTRQASGECQVKTFYHYPLWLWSKQIWENHGVWCRTTNRRDS
jgi:hypothetical protein